MLQWKSKKYYTNWVCVFVVLDIRYGMRMRPLSALACPILQNLSTFSHKWHNFRRKKKVTEHKMCVLIFSTTFVWNISQSEKKWEWYDKKICIGLRVKYTLFLSNFNENWIFSTDFRKIPKYQISWKSVQWEPSCFMRMDRRTDRHDEANSRLSQLCESAYKAK